MLATLRHAGARQWSNRAAMAIIYYPRNWRTSNPRRTSSHTASSVTFYNLLLYEHVRIRDKRIRRRRVVSTPIAYSSCMLTARRNKAILPGDGKYA